MAKTPREKLAEAWYKLSRANAYGRAYKGMKFTPAEMEEIAMFTEKIYNGERVCLMKHTVTGNFLDTVEGIKKAEQDYAHAICYWVEG